MRRLEQSEIEHYASYPNAQVEIVRNILIAIGPDSATDLNELFSSARTQGWNRSTITAILEGIAHASTPHRREIDNSSNREKLPQTVRLRVQDSKR